MIGVFVLLVSFAQAPSPWDALARLRHNDPAVRQAACRELGAMGQRAPCGIRPLIELLDDPALDVRIAAAEALGDIGHVAVRELLHADAHWQNPDEPTRADVREPGFHLRAGLPIPRTLLVWSAPLEPQPGEPSREVRLALRRVGKLVAPALLAVLQSERATVAARRRAMRELQSIRPLDPDFVPTLIELLAHDELKEHAAFAMASLGTEIADGLPALVRHLTIDPNASQLIWCFLGPPDRDRPPDYFALHDEIRNPRLAPRGDRRQAQRMLAQALPTVGPLEVRAAIARELRDSDDPSVRRHLVPLLESPETAIEAAQGLLLQGGKVGKRAEDLLLEAIRKSDDGTPVFVVPAEMAVRWLRDPNRQVRDAATKSRVEIRQWTPAAKAALAKVLAEGDADAKLRVISLSARLPVATPELERALRSVLTGPHVELHGWAAAVLVDLDVVDDRLAEPMTAGMLRKWTMNERLSFPERLAPVAMRSAETEDADFARTVLLALLRQGPAAAAMVPRLLALRNKPEVGHAVDWVLDGIVTETFADRCKRLRTGLRTAPDADPADDAPSICMFPVRLRDSVADLQRRAVKKADDGSGAVFGYSKPLAVFGVDGALAAIGSPEAIAAIIKRAGDPLLDDVERTSAVRVLPYVGTAGLPAADAVKRVLESQPRFAVRVLAGIGAEIPDELLQRAARSDNQVENIPEVQLGSIGRAPPAVPKLLRYLGFGVDAALGDRGPAAAAALVPVLREVLTGKSEAMRTQALHAVNMLEAGTEPLLGELIACLDSREPMVVAGASYALARLGPAAAPAVPRWGASVRPRQSRSCAGCSTTPTATCEARAAWGFGTRDPRRLRPSERCGCSWTTRLRLCWPARRCSGSRRDVRFDGSCPC